MTSAKQQIHSGFFTYVHYISIMPKKTNSEKPGTRRKKDFAPHIDARNAPACSVEGCDLRGEYKAPKSREQINEYDWYCLEHIRERNSQWDYFSGMDSGEIEAFIHDSVTGHRPTWSRESRLRQHYYTLQDKLYEFLHDAKPQPAQPRLPAKTRKALAAMELVHPYTIDELKIRYRVLVKKYHPDLNKGDKELEEKFKHITSAYKYLAEQISES
jgi:hypothetical protein